MSEISDFVILEITMGFDNLMIYVALITPHLIYE